MTVGLTGGTAYKVQLGGFNAASGGFALTIATAPAANDNFAAATVLTGSTPSAPFDTGSATKEAGEPNHVGLAGGASVWYTWTPSLGGDVVADCPGTTTGVNLLAVYTGGAVNALTEVASGFCRVPFAVQAGTAYRIALDGDTGSGSVLRGLGTLQITQGGVTGSPAPLDFGAQEVFTLGAARTVTIANGSGHPATLFGSPATQGANADDVIVLSGGTCVSGMVLAPAATCTVKLRFSPEATGVRSANLSVPYKLDAVKVNSPSVALTGSGTPVTAGPQGPAGSAGSNGADGSGGPTGLAGRNGTNGTPGAPVPRARRAATPR